MRVRYSPPALLQLEEIHRYIAQHNRRAAKAVVTRIEDLCEKLGEFPGMGTKTNQPGVRVLPVVRYPYLIFYLFLPAMDEVRILRIRHGRRKPLQSGQI
jgi:plasmid stabilization system protein ParE